MSEDAKRRVPWFLWPFYAIWRLLTFILNVTGRLICAIVGLLLMVVGLMVTATILGAPIGIPLVVLGLLLLLRSIF